MTESPASGTSGITLWVGDEPDAADIAAIDERLDAFTVGASGHDDAQQLAVFGRDATGRMIAGAHGWTWGSCCELLSLWVEESARRRGLGLALLQAAEDEARRRGCRQVVLFTHAVQAPRLYLEAGYEVVGTVEDYPLGSAAYWFRKRL